MGGIGWAVRMGVGMEVIVLRSLSVCPGTHSVKQTGWPILKDMCECTPPSSLDTKVDIATGGYT